MKTCNYSSLSAYSLEGRPDAVLLNRLGSELARVYRDTLEASLPPGLQELAQRLEVQSGRRDGPDRPQATHLS
jgi:hypothetical protein